MFKRIGIRFVNGFCYSIAITMIIHGILMLSTGNAPLLPEYTARFDSQLTAYVSQLMLVGIMSAVTSAGTIVFEAKKIGLLVQSILFLFIMLSAWIPVACIAWGFHKYITSMIVTICSIVVSYGICWGVQYRLCRKEIERINAKLSEKKG